MSAMDKFLDSAFVSNWAAGVTPSLGFLNTSVSESIDLPIAPASVSAGIQQLCGELGHKVVSVSEDQLMIAMITKKTMMSWELATGIHIIPTPQGSHVEIYMQNAPGRPKALLDARKNKKAAQKFVDQIRTSAQGG